MTSENSTARRLREAANTIRKHAADATPGPWRSHDTHLGQYGYAATVLSGEGNSTDLRAWLPSMSQEPWDEARNVWPDAAWIALMHPGVGEALAAVFDKWARMGEVDPDLLNWVGGPETVALADLILGMPAVEAPAGPRTACDVCGYVPGWVSPRRGATCQHGQPGMGGTPADGGAR